MLPSRGAIRSLSTARTSLKTQSFSNTSRILDGQGRQFGTSSRNVGVAWNGRAGLRPSVLRASAGAALIAGSVPARRAISFNFWSGTPAKTTEMDALPSTAAESIKPQTITPESSAAAASPTPIEAAASPEVPAYSLDSINANPVDLDMSQFSNISDIPETIGYLKTLGLDFGWGPSSMMQWMFEHVHVYTGLPWWGTITVTTILLRLLLFQPTLKGQQTSAKMQELTTRPEYNALKEKMTASMSAGDQQTMNDARLALSAIHKREGVNPLASAWSFLQIPFGYGSFIVLNNMAKIPVPSLETGGTLWFTDLAVSDPFYILPLMGPLGMIVMFGSQMKTSPPQTRAQMKLMGMILVPLSFVVTLWLPAAIQFYFVVSTVLAIGQNYLFRNTLFRRIAGLPPLMPTPAPAASQSAPGAAASKVIAARAVEQPKTSSFSSAITNIKQTIHDAKGGMGNYVESQQQKKGEKDLKSWEEKRAEEDRRKILNSMKKRNEK